MCATPEPLALCAFAEEERGARQSTDAACARAAELGGAVRVPGFDTPYGRIAVVVDLQGAVFTVVQPPPQPPSG